MTTHSFWNEGSWIRRSTNQRRRMGPTIDQRLATVRLTRAACAAAGCIME